MVLQISRLILFFALDLQEKSEALILLV